MLMNYYFFIFSLLFWVGANAQSDTTTMYIFGHSLLDHRPPAISTPSDETTVPHWIQDISNFESEGFKCTGQYGFLTNHDDLPPVSQWGYDIVNPAWESDLEPFSDADFNTILVTAANFIQYVPPHLDHPIDATTFVVQSTQTIFDWVNNQEEDVSYYIYANWPEMDLMNAYPPTPPTDMEVADYHTQTIGSFTDWWIEYQDSMLASRPLLNTRLIPVGQIISQILTSVIPGEVPFTELYEDSDPHGRPSIYFLAGMITYMAVYEKEISPQYSPGTIVHEGIRNNLQLIKDFIWSSLLDFNDSNGESRVFNSSPITGVENMVLSHTEIMLYPNPNLGSFEISGVLGDYQIDILDSSGTVFENIDAGGQTVVTVDIESLPSGLYFIRVLNNQGGSLYVERIIKM